MSLRSLGLTLLTSVEWPTVNAKTRKLAKQSKLTLKKCTLQASRLRNFPEGEQFFPHSRGLDAFPNRARSYSVWRSQPPKIVLKSFQFLPICLP